ncbi:MAG: hypothetical protein RL653_1931, partial [Pseudomonadota bacterium]
PADRPGLGMSGQGAGGGGHNRGGAFESFAAPPAGAAPKAAAPAPMMRAEALRDSVGSGAVALSRETKRMKEAERPADGGVRTAAGRTFLLQGGTWTQTKLPADGKRLKVRFMGAAWSELLRRFPQLKGALALGDRVVVEVAPGKVVEVQPGAGEEKAEAVTAFLR